MPIGAMVFCFGFFMFVSGIIGVLSNNQQASMSYQPRPPAGMRPARAQQSFAASGPVQEPARILPSLESSSSTGAQPMATGVRGDFERARIGQNITVNHP